MKVCALKLCSMVCTMCVYVCEAKRVRCSIINLSFIVIRCDVLCIIDFKKCLCECSLHYNSIRYIQGLLLCCLWMSSPISPLIYVYNMENTMNMVKRKTNLIWLKIKIKKVSPNVCECNIVTCRMEYMQKKFV